MIPIRVKDNLPWEIFPAILRVFAHESSLISLFSISFLNGTPIATD
jgi:hypothetical protein